MLGCQSIQSTFIHSLGNSSGTWAQYCCHPKDPLPRIYKTSRVLKQVRPSKSNISKEKWRAIKELRTDKEHLILTAEKGVAQVVIDKKDYTQKMKQLLEDNNTCRPLKMDPTNRQKNRLINILRNMKSEGRLEDHTYKKMYPTGASSPKLYGLT